MGSRSWDGRFTVNGLCMLAMSSGKDFAILIRGYQFHSTLVY